MAHPTKTAASTNGHSVGAAVKPTLPLVRRQVRLIPKVDRQMHLVDSRMRDVFQSLVNGEAPWPLLIHGPAGSGKTLAALSLCDICETSFYIAAEGLADQTMKSTPEELDAFWRRIASKDLAVLDELGCRQVVKDLHYISAKRFADVRDQEANSVAIYISNLSPQQLYDAYDDRFGSRIACGTVFHLDNEDRRYSR